MRKSILLASCVALAAVACSDQPTANTNDTPSLRAAQGDRSDLVLYATWPEIPPSDPWLQGPFPCMNGGMGERAWYWGPEALYYGKRVVTQSGNELTQGYLVLGGDGIDHYRGAVSGDEWVSEPFAFSGKTGMFSLRNGVWMLAETGSEEFTNLRTGERIRVLFQWNYHFAADGSVIGNLRDAKVVNCHILTH